MSQPQLWVLAGPNGAGKSTIDRRHIIGRVPFVNADDIAYQLDPSDVNSPAAHLRAGRLEAVRDLEDIDSFCEHETGESDDMQSSEDFG